MVIWFILPILHYILESEIVKTIHLFDGIKSVSILEFSHNFYNKIFGLYDMQDVILYSQILVRPYWIDI
jgi:hypothetical protein